MAYDDAKAKALGILGKKAKFPKLSGNLDKDIDASNAAERAMNQARTKFADALLAWKQAVDRTSDTCEAYKDIFEGNDFGLDAKNPDEKKKIDQATKLLADDLTDTISKLKKHRTVCESMFKDVTSGAKQIDKL